jgi:hypothetical protein
MKACRKLSEFELGSKYVIYACFHLLITLLFGMHVISCKCSVFTACIASDRAVDTIVYSILANARLQYFNITIMI